MPHPIHEIAKEAAGHLYERLMCDERSYEAWRRQNPDASPPELARRFVEKNWSKCIDYARATLSGMLRQADVSETVKAQIADVLAQDDRLRREDRR